jgi:hypothetical protein
MNRSRALCLFAAVSAAFPLIGCTGGQTGEETDQECVETKTALDLDQTSPLGFSAQELLAVTGSAVTAAGAWRMIPNLPYGPETGESSLTLTFGSMPSAQFVKSEIGPGQGAALEACTDRLEVLLDVSASTGGGALDEHFQAVLTASNKGDLGMSKLFDPKQLSGQFAFEPQALGAKRFTRLILSGHWFAGSFTGRLSAGIEDGAQAGPNSSVSFTDAPLACFSNSEAGAPNDCAQ